MSGKMKAVLKVGDNRFAVRTILFSGGERFPILFDRLEGQPVFDATIYALTEVRGRNLASNTIDSTTRSIMILNQFLEGRGIDLENRMQQGRVLDIGEIDDLVRFCRLPLSELREKTTKDAQHRNVRQVKVESLERVRMRATKSHEIAPDSASTRLTYIRKYIEWLGTGQLLRLSIANPARSPLELAIRTFTTAINARMPSDRARRTIGQREGLTPEATTRLIDVSDPAANENPWKSSHVRERNQLMIHLLLELGIRRGEALGLKVSDINFRTNTLLVARRADDIDDPRRNQPNAKTRDRLLYFSDQLACRLRSYILGARRAIPGARRHEFVFVATGNGNPVSLELVTKIFQSLRARVPDLPDELTGHVLRHTWNDEFSKAMDASNVPEERENNMRSYLMGWSPTSGTAATYTRRHIRRKAKEVSLSIQAKRTKGGMQ